MTKEQIARIIASSISLIRYFERDQMRPNRLLVSAILERLEKARETLQGYSKLPTFDEWEASLQIDGDFSFEQFFGDEAQISEYRRVARIAWDAARNTSPEQEALSGWVEDQLNETKD